MLHHCTFPWLKQATGWPIRSDVSPYANVAAVFQNYRNVGKISAAFCRTVWNLRFLRDLNNFVPFAGLASRLQW
jgi:hypothetical protein